MEMWQFIILALVFFTVFFIGTAWLANMMMAWAGRRFSEKRQNEYLKALEKLLPGKNCGECGYENCEEYAAAVFYGRADKDKCPHGKESLPADMEKVVAEFIDLLESGESIDQIKKDEKERRFRQ